jgi:hypothetical protein
MLLIHKDNGNRYEITNTHVAFVVKSYALHSFYHSKAFKECITSIIKLERAYTFLNLTNESIKKINSYCRGENNLSANVLREILVDADFDKSLYQKFIDKMQWEFTHNVESTTFQDSVDFPVFEEIATILDKHVNKHHEGLQQDHVQDLDRELVY